MTLRNWLWWLIVSALGLTLECFVPGIDSLLPLLFVALEEARLVQICVMTGIYVLLHEGLGTLAFGGVLIWYLPVILVFQLARRVFSTRSAAFALAVCGAAGLSHYGVITVFCSLQDLVFDHRMIFIESIIQIPVAMLAWNIARWTRRGISHETAS